MPYGVDKKIGGDSKENDSWMEDCVTKVMNNSGKDKSSAIAICKAQLQKKKESKSSLEPFVYDPSLVEFETTFMNNFIRMRRLEGLSYSQAKAAYEMYLSKMDYEIK